MPLKVHELLKILREDGWYLVRQKGSHRQYHHPIKTGTATIAGKSSVELPPATLHSVLKQAQLKK
jgi:predicted RNA binding protein YcfA (HicA-like mRNA interferase family)